MKRWIHYSKVFIVTPLMVPTVVIVESMEVPMGFTEEPMELQTIVTIILIPVHQTVSIPMGKNGAEIVNHAISMSIQLVMGIIRMALVSRGIQAMGSRRGIFMR